MWHLYLLECTNGALYTGIAIDVAARYEKHVSGKGAKYTRANPPIKIIGIRAFPDRSSASKAEYQVKQLPPKDKLKYFLTNALTNDCG